MPDWLQVALRTLFAIIVLFSLTKLLGKRQVSQLSFFEYITGITIGSLAAYISLDMEANWFLGLVALSVWVLVSLGIEYLQIKSKTARTFIDSTATVLIKDGKILEDNLKKERISTDDILEQLRKRNVFKAAHVEFAILEPSGEMNVLLKKEHQPLTPAHLGIRVESEHEPQMVIQDGNIMNEPLATIGLNRSWLSAELEKLGVSIEDVFLGQVDSYGQLYVDLYDDQIKVPESQLKVSLLAQLKKCEADLELLGLASKSPHTKVIYEQCSKSLEKVIMDLRHC
jgi:uncharacterized membrane protein YcaP (DUF421 family)